MPQTMRLSANNRSEGLVPITPGYATTLEGRRYYTITMMSGLSTFKGSLCKHSVTTTDFSSHDGTCRT
jgi:hypothetical protein